MSLKPDNVGIGERASPEVSDSIAASVDGGAGAFLATARGFCCAFVFGAVRLVLARRSWCERSEVFFPPAEALRLEWIANLIRVEKVLRFEPVFCARFTAPLH